MDKRLERILPRVQKPARYVGGEYNEVRKDPREVDFRFAFCFPDTYEIGMSNLGYRILYGILNDMPGVWCQRAFAPWGDMEEEMRAAGIPLYALESGDPVRDFDIIGFSVGYEMAYTAILNMLDLAGVPLRGEDRPGLTPLVIAGGTAMYNAEPVADFIDMALIGEGEDLLPEVVNLCRRAKAEGWDKPRLLRAAAQIQGVYVPSLYDVAYNSDGTIAAITPRDGAPAKVVKRVVHDMDRAYYPAKTIVPSTEIVHDRVTLEVFRGCIRGCRFCQAGYVYRPVRCRSKDLLVRYGQEAVADSGYQEMTLSSLSTSDYPDLVALCDGLEPLCERDHVNLSLPSLRADNFSMELMQRLQKGRKAGLTFAPEAGTQRLRDAINKNLTEEDLHQSLRTAFSGGWNAVKLYFMLGLPRRPTRTCWPSPRWPTTSCTPGGSTPATRAGGCGSPCNRYTYSPKPFTAFQWEPQISREEYERRVKLLREAITAKAVTYNWHDGDTSFLEAVLARGDRRLGRVLERVHQKGGRLDAWSDYFSLDRWMEAFAECGIDPAFYANRERAREEILPWSMISCYVSDDYLWRQRELAYQSVTTPDCRTRCSGCGANVVEGGECYRG